MQPLLLAALQQDHRRLASILEALETNARRCSEGARGTYLDLLATLVDYIVEYPDAVHHPLEDRMFVSLVGKALTPEEQRVLADNIDQHQELTAASKTLAADIDAVIGNSADGLSALQDHVAAYVDLQRRHMRNEEELVFPLALRTLSDEEWDVLDQGEAERHDPLFEQRLSRYESLYEYAVGEA